jgi:predicted house-cleaning noncanonical NTP pyrophosphatase (MazG superfamily)
MIQTALELLREKREVREAAEVFQTTEEARAFSKAVKKLREEKVKLPKGGVKKIAREVADEMAARKKAVKEEVAERKSRGEIVGRTRGVGDTRREIRVAVQKRVKNVSEKEARIMNLESDVEKFSETVRACRYAGPRVLGSAKEVDVTTVRGLKPLLVAQELADLLSVIRKVLVLFGYDYKNLQIEGGMEK